jgi:voltage-gated sodium channel
MRVTLSFMSTELASNSWKVKIENIMAHAYVQHTLIALIVINAAILGFETSPEIMASWGDWLHALDHAILVVFIVEIVVLMAVRGWGFFKDPWSVFDFLVVSIALIPASGSMAVLRALRVLRVLRLVNKITSMRKVVAGLLGSMPGLGSVFGLIVIIFYVASVIATNLFRDKFPNFFGSLGETAFTLFQIMTLESWSEGIARPVMEVFPYSWMFFIFFILIATFIVFNLFIAVIVDSINSESDKDKKAHSAEFGLEAEIRALREELQEIKQLIKK